VAAIGVAQEFQRVWRAHEGGNNGPAPDGAAVVKWPGLTAERGGTVVN